MFEDEYHGGVRQEKRAGIRPFIPVLGFLLILSMGAIGFVIGPNVAAFASQRMGFEISDEIIWIFRGVIFFLLLAVAAMIYAFAVPKKKTDKLATEKQLLKEKQEKEKERLAEKKRKALIQRKMAEERRKKSGR